jgi:hypothetical protein
MDVVNGNAAVLAKRSTAPPIHASLNKLPEGIFRCIVNLKPGES